MSENHYTVGDTITIRAQLLLNGVGEVLTDCVVKAGIVCKNMSTFAAGTTSVECTLLDELTGEVEAIFPKANTALILPGEYWIEFQSTKGGDSVTYDRVLVRIFGGAIA